MEKSFSLSDTYDTIKFWQKILKKLLYEHETARITNDLMWH